MGDTICPLFKTKIQGLLVKAQQMKLPEVGVFQWVRTFDEQNHDYDLGRTIRNPDGVCPEKPMGNIITNARGGDSWHQYGLAADLVFKVEGKWSWDGALPWHDLGELGMGLGLEWGGSWLGKVDKPHFELRGKLRIWEARTLHQAHGLQAVWDAVTRSLEE